MFVEVIVSFETNTQVCLQSSTCGLAKSPCAQVPSGDEHKRLFIEGGGL